MPSQPVCLRRRTSRFAIPRVLAIGIVLPLAVAGCAVGPDFKSPDAPQADGYTVETLKPRPGAERQWDWNPKGLAFEDACRAGPSGARNTWRAAATSRGGNAPNPSERATRCRCRA